jgi:uridylate kinase
MGMLATVINGMALQGLRRQRDAYPQTALKIEAIAEPYIKRRAVSPEKGRIVILEPEPETLILHTDTAAVLRGVEIHADVILKGTRVDVYDSDPEKMQTLQNLILFLLTT